MIDLLKELADKKILRDSTGRFQKGYSGNAGGRPKDEHKVAELARSYTTEAIDTLVALRCVLARMRECVVRPLRRF